MIVLGFGIIQVQRDQYFPILLLNFCFHTVPQGITMAETVLIFEGIETSQHLSCLQKEIAGVKITRVLQYLNNFKGIHLEIKKELLAL